MQKNEKQPIPSTGTGPIMKNNSSLKNEEYLDRMRLCKCIQFEARGRLIKELCPVIPFRK